MNRAELIEKIASKTNSSKTSTEKFLHALIETVQDTVAQDEEVKLVGFGNFTSSLRGERKGRNPKTGEEVVIPSCRLPKFKPGKEFRERLS